MARPHIEPFVELNEDFRNISLSNFPKGMEYKVLSLDTDNGACSLKVRYHGGYKRPPGLSYSDVEIFVLGGEIKIGDQTCREGHYMFVPAGLAQGAWEVPMGAEALVFYNDSEPSFEAGDRNHPLCLKEGYISLNSFEDAPWASGSIVSPSTATGLFLKMLRFDPLTEAMTFLYTIAPEYIQDNISYHDCCEESYHIWGTSWMMQFGDLPTGGYFWRPPYINHGSFRSKHGCIALGRTDSKLHNYFHYNPWTTPDENRRRAAAHFYRQRPQLFTWVNSLDGHNHPHGVVGQVPAPADFEHPEYEQEPRVMITHDHAHNEHHHHHHAHSHDHSHSHSHDHSHDHSHGHSHDHDHD